MHDGNWVSILGNGVNIINLNPKQWGATYLLSLDCDGGHVIVSSYHD